VPQALLEGGSGPARPAALSRAFASGLGVANSGANPPDRIPYERENAIRFFHVDQISAIRADGHYTMVMRNGAEFFCPWSISRVEQVIKSPPFVRTHRSYLVNLKHVTGFKREGDKAYCLVSEDAKTRIPVSRSHIAEVQKALGLA
jgi:DNA-binding LytR/AlgR family response regulator